ncbi:MAG TPA: PAS domain S-box protein, partial [Acidobacteria bacterium]|nr:PAS domain S-box protein [Acidobacteriota bacterium]
MTPSPSTGKRPEPEVLPLAASPSMAGGKDCEAPGGDRITRPFRSTTAISASRPSSSGCINCWSLPAPATTTTLSPCSASPQLATSHGVPPASRMATPDDTPPFTREATNGASERLSARTTSSPCLFRREIRATEGSDASSSRKTPPAGVPERTATSVPRRTVCRRVAMVAASRSAVARAATLWVRSTWVVMASRLSRSRGTAAITRGTSPTTPRASAMRSNRLVFHLPATRNTPDSTIKQLPCRRNHTWEPAGSQSVYQFGTLGCRVKHSPPDGPTPTVPPLTLWYSPHVSTSIRIRVREASASTRTMVSAIALAFLLTVGVAILQQTFPWTGTTAQFLILSAVMATLSLVAAAFFRARSRIVHGAGDSWIGLIFLLMGLHFTLRVLLAPLQLAPRHLVPIVLASWITTQLTSAIILLVSMSGHLSSTRRGSAMVAGGGLVLAGATFAIVLQLKQAHIVVGIQSLNTAILMTFLAATVLTLVHAIRERQSRAIWLGTAFIVITAGHADLSWSMKSYDSPFMWGHVLLLIGLTIPIVTAVSENLELMASQASLNRRIRKLGRRVEALLDSLPVLVVTLDAKTHLRYANRRAHRLLGIPPSTSSTSDIAPWTAGLTTEDRERLRRDVTRLISGELDGVTREVRLTSPDDTVHWLSLELRPIHDPVEDEPRILVAGAEITDLLAAQRTAERRHERLTLLTNLAQSLSVETTEEGVLGRLLELGAIQFGMEAVAVLRAGPERRHLELGALAGDLPELRRALEDGPILDKAVKSFNDAFPLVVEPHAEEHPAPLNRRVAMTPLLAGGQAAG